MVRIGLLIHLLFISRVIIARPQSGRVRDRARNGCHRHDLLTKLEPSTSQGITLIAMMICIVGATLGMLWMEIERLQADLERLASTDPLTGALNRRAFLGECEREIARCLRSGGSFALALLDLDHFKRLNDTHGHPAGDAALCHVVAILHKILRSHDVVCRLGGEEFAALMPDTSGQTAVSIAERLLSIIQETPLDYGGVPVTITASCGVAVYPHNGSNWSAILSMADQALYAAKTAGRNRVVASYFPTT